MGSVTSEPHCITLPKLSCRPHNRDTSPAALQRAAEEWLQEFNKIIIENNVPDLANIVHRDAWLRDMLALTWDFRSLNGVDKITSYFQQNCKQAGLKCIQLRTHGAYVPRVKNPAPDVEWLEAMLDFETAAGAGSGMLRLVVDDDGKWKLFMMNFMLQNLKGFDERTHLNRPSGGNNSLDGTGNWFEQRQRQKDFLDDDPAVVIIGAGQSGLNVGARLGQLGVPTLIIDKNERVGDNWRHRYRTLVTHDPVQYTHMAYMPFPSSWPMFTPKDKLADWFEAYANLMELNIWAKTTIDHASYDDKSGKWTVTLRRGDRSTRTLHPRHVVLATGHAGEALVPTFPGQETFRGKVYHTSAHQDASLHPEIAGKKVIVVGTGNSGHDICQNYCENGADVTMLQRGGTYVISAKKGVFMLHAGLYDESSPPTADADIYGQSMPMPVQFALNQHSTKAITAADHDLLDGLTKAGFQLDFGPQDSGIFRKYMTRGGGYYIDVGCSQLIADGQVKVRQSPEGIRAFEEDGIVLADGSKVSADVVVLATGYDNMRTTARKILGGTVADQLRDVWDLDEEGELNAMWRYSGHPGFWYMGGNLALCRIYSLLVGLQIKACEEGLYVPPE